MTQAKSNKKPTLNRHVSFEDPAHSSASDDESKAVEVSFDTQNPYRRKSSLVASETIHPRLRDDKTSCIVHQFLQSHQRGSEVSKALVDAHNVDGNDHTERLSQNLEHLQVNKSKQSRSPSPAYRNGPVHRRVLMEIECSEGSDVGQVDEKEWKHDFSKGLPLSEGHPDHDRSSLQTPCDDRDMHTRLLTKKQLSDMAWGVRELSRRLGTMRLKFRAKNIFLLTKIFDRDLIPKTRELTKWLLDPERDVHYTVWVENQLKDNKSFDAPNLVDEIVNDAIAGQETRDQEKEHVHASIVRRLRYWDESMCRSRGNMFDFVITLGGDGTVLYASWLFQRIVPPVLSFALGSLGFLTKFDFGNYQETLTTAFREGVTVSLRLRFEGTVMRSQRKKAESPSITESETEADDDEIQRRRDLVEELIGEEKDDEHTHRPDGTYEILNEVVIDRGPNPTMSCTEIFGDDEHFTSVMADGVCVSTPTGSTAYNLAAGGSLCHPENPVMLVTSICAHTLSFRPIILPDTIVLRIGVPYDARTSSWASFDGRERIELQPGDYVTISASRYPFASVTLRGRRSEDWVNSIQHKLGWNTRQKQKTFKEWEK